MDQLAKKSTQWIAHIFICIAITFSFSLHANTRIGQVIFSTGDIKATGNGATRSLQRGSTINEGDIIKSGRNTRSQIRMSDGALIALRPNTEFSFEEYNYDKDDGRNNGSLLNLIKGGFRTITGFIGKYNKQNYRVKTAVATIGIRGTHYGLTLCQQGDCNEDGKPGTEDGLYGSVIDGEIFAENETGQHIFSNDEFFHVQSSTSKPRGLIKPPGVVFDQAKRSQKLKKMAATKKAFNTLQKHQLQRAGMLSALSLEQHKKIFLQNYFQAVFESTQDTNSSLVSYIEPAANGSVMAFSFNEVDTGGALPSILPRLEGITAGSQPTDQFFINSAAKEQGLFVPVVATLFVDSLESFTLGDAKVLEPRSLSIGGVSVGWGRWSREFTYEQGDIEKGHIGQLHYIIATNTTSLAQLTSLTGTFNYTAINGTRATDRVGNIAANFANVTMGVTFGTTSTIDNLNITTVVGGNVYDVTGAGIISGPTTNVSLTSGNLCGTCAGQANIAFFGSDAQGAGAVYAIGDTNVNNSINGVSVLIKN